MDSDAALDLGPDGIDHRLPGDAVTILQTLEQRRQEGQRRMLPHPTTVTFIGQRHQAQKIVDQGQPMEHQVIRQVKLQLRESQTRKHRGFHFHQ